MFNRKEWIRNWKLKNKEKLKTQARSLYQRTKEKRRAQCRALYHKTKNPLKQKAKALRLRWGLTLEQLDYYIKLRESRCDICKQTDKLVIDHDHLKGNIRGFLCGKCNKGIGLLQDNVSILCHAILYLQLKLKSQIDPGFLPLIEKKQIGS
jgi:Recombination endonuclease VII